MSITSVTAKRRSWLIACAVLATARVVAADSHYWMGASGYWSDAASWSLIPGGAGGAGPPTNGDTARLQPADSAAATIDGGTSYTAPGLHQVYIDSTSGTMNVVQTSGALYVNESVFLALSGRGSYSQSAGAHNTRFLDLGCSAGGIGTYLLTGTGSLTVRQRLSVGAGGTGHFLQTGGSLGGLAWLWVGSSAGGVGTYRMEAGSISIQQLAVGWNGAGTFTQTGGAATIDGPVYIANGSLSTGLLRITGGTLLGGESPVNHTHIGGGEAGAGGTGTLQILDTGQYTTASQIIVYPAGRIELGGGTLNCGGTLTLNGGRFDWTGGTFSLNSARALSVQGGGTVTFNSAYSLPDNTGISVTDGRLSVAGLDVGTGGSGTILVSGAASQVTSPAPNLWGSGGGHTATITFGNGSNGSFGDTQLGRSGGSGTLTVSGDASLTFGNLTAGGSGGGTGFVLLEGASSQVTLSGSSRLTLGVGGTGKLRLAGGTFHTGTGTTTIGPGGTIELAGGTIQLSGSGAVLEQHGPLLFDGGRLTYETGTFTSCVGSTLTIQNGSVVTLPGLSATDYKLKVLSGGTLDLGSAPLQLSGISIGTIDGGSLNAGTIQVSGGGTVVFNSGTLNVTGESGLSITVGGPFGNLVDLSVTEALEVAGPISVGADAALILNGGKLSAGTLSGTGILQFNTGLLRLTSSDLSVGPGGLYGGLLSLGPNCRVEIVGAGKLINPVDCTVYMSGGTLSAAGGIENHGELQLAGGAARISGPSVDNTGTIRGTGRIDGNLINSGTIRASAGQELAFWAGSAVNSGMIQLLGGLVEFNGHLDNDNLGQIVGEGSLFANVGLMNNGTIMLTGGTSHVRGELTNSPMGHVLVTGGSHSTFYSAVTNIPGSEFKVSDASIAAFLGPVIGLSAFTGHGTIIFEGPTSLGELAAGTAIVEPTGVLSASRVRQAALIVRGSAFIDLNGTDEGTSRLNSLTIEGSLDAWTGMLDLADNDLVIDYTVSGPFSRIRNQIKCGYNLGSWMGKGITSSAADATTHALGYGQNTQLHYVVFSGQPVDLTSVLVKYTYYGDSNLDGVVDITDLGALATHWQAAGPWTSGDFDYSGFIDITDLGKLATNWQAGVGSPLGPSLDEALASLGLPGVGVPEPSLVVGAAALCLLRTRRFRSTAGRPIGGR